MMKDDNDEIFRVPFLGLFRDPELGQVSTCLSVIYGDIYECSTEIPFPQFNSLMGGGVRERPGWSMTERVFDDCALPLAVVVLAYIPERKGGER